jgi:hypothetical protein
MNAKLHIDVLQGVLDVEGDEVFVKSVYDDFKSRLTEQVKVQTRPMTVIEAPIGAEVIAESERLSQRKRKTSIRRAGGANGGKIKFADYTPKFDPNLNLAKLEDFYGKSELRNHREKILVFAIFVRDELKIEPCSADHIFSCYQTIKSQTEIPEAFVQAIRDAQSKGGYVELVSPQEIRVTIAGENYFNQKIKRRESVK